jgi:hypothetical protein
MFSLKYTTKHLKIPISHNLIWNLRKRTFFNTLYKAAVNMFTKPDNMAQNKNKRRGNSLQTNISHEHSYKSP